MAAVEVVPIEGVEEWFQVFEKSDSKCYVIDCHAPWAGRVDVMDTVWNRLGLDVQNMEERLEIRSLSMTPEVTAEVRNTFRFLLRMDQSSPFLKDKSQSNQAISTSQETLMRHIMTEMESGEESKEADANFSLSCEPLFLVLRFRSLAAVIRGVDPPSLTNSIQLNLPDISEGGEEEEGF